MPNVLVNQYNQQISKSSILKRNGKEYRFLGFVSPNSSFPKGKIIVREVGALGGFKEFSADSFNCEVKECQPKATK